MTPAIANAVIARFAPYVGRMAQTAPGFLATLIARLRVSGAVVGDRVADVIAWVRANPANAGMLLATIASLGYSAAGLIDSGDPDAEVIKNQLEVVRSRAIASPDDGRKAAAQLIAAGGVSEKLNMHTADKRGEDLLSIAVLGFAKQFFGGADGAIEAHIMMQAFFEMPLDDVRHGMLTLNLSPETVRRANDELKKGGAL